MRPEAIRRALRFLEDPDGDDLDAAARELFAFQFANNEPYRRFCRRRGCTPQSVNGWADVPAVPVEAFALVELACATPAMVFRTSGTSRGEARRGRHALPETALYDAAWPPPFERFVLGDARSLRVLSLIPAFAQTGDSSLSYMADGILARYGAPGSARFLTAAGLDGVSFRGALRAAEAEGTPVLLLGTALAFAHVIDESTALGERFALAPGSRLMDTGGFKGRRREVTRGAMLHAYAERFGIAADSVIGEYGMTELSSQRYERTRFDAVRGPAAGAGREYDGPPWLRTRTLDPESLEPLPPGEVGVLAHYDLANAWTVAGVLTEDLGRVTERGVELLGRATGAELRGCSLATEEILRDA